MKKVTKTNYIYRDYQLIDGVLIKENVDDSKHLMWQFGGIPCIDAKYVWDKFKPYVRMIMIKTIKGRVFQVKADVFDKNKKIMNFGYGDQYYIDKAHWAIHDPVKRQRYAQKTEVEEEKQKQGTLL